MDTRKTKTTRRNIFVTSFSFFLVSFLGWLYETLLMLFLYGRYFDRGFLNLPFCPIYGGVVCTLYLLIGTPKDGWYARWTKKLLLHGRSRFAERIVRYAGYFLLSALFATAAELVIGLLFQNLGYELWSYSGRPLNYRGVICLPVSLFWGGLLTLFMRFFYPAIESLSSKIPRPLLVAQTLLFAVALTVDFIFCLA